MNSYSNNCRVQGHPVMNKSNDTGESWSYDFMFINLNVIELLPRGETLNTTVHFIIAKFNIVTVKGTTLDKLFFVSFSYSYPKID